MRLVSRLSDMTVALRRPAALSGPVSGATRVGRTGYILCVDILTR